jgi:hypothetical protein
MLDTGRNPCMGFEPHQPCSNLESVNNDNLNTTQTPEYTKDKDKYNVKIIKRKVSPKVSPTTYVG